MPLTQNESLRGACLRYINTTNVNKPYNLPRVSLSPAVFVLTILVLPLRLLLLLLRLLKVLTSWQVHPLSSKGHSPLC